MSPVVLLMSLLEFLLGDVFPYVQQSFKIAAEGHIWFNKTSLGVLLVLL